MSKLPITLAIDTSCDETSASVVEGNTVLSNVLPSQIEFHKKYGGVVPIIARLAHQERIDGVVNEALSKANMSINDIDFIAVTYGPGLSIALEVGIKKAKELAAANNKPLITINHMEGHLLSSIAVRKSVKNKTKSLISIIQETKFPIIGVLVSGKHTELVRVDDFGKYKIIGESVDDACGEAFDKCGRLLGLGYPAGPTVAKFSKENRKNLIIKDRRKDQSYLVTATNKITGDVYELPVGMATSKDLNFSYSGLKTAFKNLVNKLSGDEITIEAQLSNNTKGLTKTQIMDLCVVFEEAAFRPIEIKLKKAIEKYSPSEIWLGGGVAANLELRKTMRKICKSYKINYKFPHTNKLNTDNAAMIGIVANIKIEKLGGIATVNSHLNQDIHALEEKGIFLTDFFKIDRDPTLTLDTN